MVERYELNWYTVLNFMVEEKVKDAYEEIGHHYLHYSQAAEIADRIRRLIQEYLLSFYKSRTSIAILSDMNHQDIKAIEIIYTAYDMMLYILDRRGRHSIDTLIFEPRLLFAFRSIVEPCSLFIKEEEKAALQSRISKIEKFIGKYGIEDEWYNTSKKEDVLKDQLSYIFGVEVEKGELIKKESIFLLYFKYQKIISGKSKEGEPFFTLMEDRGIDYYLEQ